MLHITLAVLPVFLMRTSQLGVVFGHLDIGVPKELRELVKIAPFIMYQDAKV